jgi:hypothetical protein
MSNMLTGLKKNFNINHQEKVAWEDFWNYRKDSVL